MAQEIEKLSFEQALTELEAVVRQLESGKDDLESSIAAYTRGVELRRQCEAKLNEARARIEKITLSPEGTPQTEAFESSGK